MSREWCEFENLKQMVKRVYVIIHPSRGSVPIFFVALHLTTLERGLFDPVDRGGNSITSMIAPKQNLITTCRTLQYDMYSDVLLGYPIEIEVIILTHSHMFYK